MDHRTIEYEPEEHMEFDSLDSLDVLMSPFRLRILACFREPSTTKTAADQMGVSVTRLYRHIHRLVEHGFLKVVAERQAGKTVEKVYAVAARNVRPSARFIEEYGTRGTAELMKLGFRTVESEVVASAETDPSIDLSSDRAAFTFSRLWLSESELTELVAALEDLFASYQGRNGSIEVSILGSVVPLRDHGDQRKESHT
jgi:hypothetical protein